MERILAPLYDVESADGVVSGARPPRARRRLPGGAGRHPARRRRRLQPVRGDAAQEPGHRRHPHHRLDLAARREALPLARGRRLLLPVQAVRAARAARAGRSLRAAAARAARQGGVRRDAGGGPRRARGSSRRACSRRGRVEAAGFRAIGSFLSATRSAATSGSALVERDGSLVVAVADVVGHGVSAAMYAGMLRSTLEAARRSIPIRRGCRRRWSRASTSSSRRATPRMFYGQLSASGTLRYWNAGIRRRSLRARRRRLRAARLDRAAAVARVPASSARSGGDTLEPAIACWSTATARARRATRARPSSASRVSSARSERSGKSDLGGALDGLRRLVFDHLAGRPLEDDVTMVLVERG